MISSHRPGAMHKNESKVPLVREAGRPYEPANMDDPLRAWLELMEVVEALCTRWPQRSSSLRDASFRL